MTWNGTLHGAASWLLGRERQRNWLEICAFPTRAQPQSIAEFTNRTREVAERRQGRRSRSGSGVRALPRGAARRKEVEGGGRKGTGHHGFSLWSLFFPQQAAPLQTINQDVRCSRKQTSYAHITSRRSVIHTRV